MKLILNELKTTVEQEYTCKKTANVIALRPHLYRHRFATGNLKMQIKEGDSVLAESSLININDIGNSDFFHGYVRFDIKAILKVGLNYKFVLLHQDGYEFSETSYIGWCNGFDLGKYKVNFTPDTSLNYPLDLEIWERK